MAYQMAYQTEAALGRASLDTCLSSSVSNIIGFGQDSIQLLCRPNPNCRSRPDACFGCLVATTYLNGNYMSFHYGPNHHCKDRVDNWNPSMSIFNHFNQARARLPHITQFRRCHYLLERSSNYNAVPNFSVFRRIASDCRFIIIISYF